LRLSTFIIENIEPILKQWEEFARTLQPGRLMTVAALRHETERMLRFIAADIETTQSPAEQHDKSLGRGSQLADGAESAAHEHGRARAVDHFTFADMVSQYRALRAAVTSMWLEAAAVDYETVMQLVRFNEYRPDSRGVGGPLRHDAGEGGRLVQRVDRPRLAQPAERDSVIVGAAVEFNSVA
jgi:RsbT co-antagonist protein rsbRD N-terminal domain